MLPFGWSRGSVGPESPRHAPQRAETQQTPTDCRSTRASLPAGILPHDCDAATSASEASDTFCAPAKIGAGDIAGTLIALPFFLKVEGNLQHFPLAQIIVVGV